ncbi:cytochrome P450 [Nonomuraea basaltis]|uniref:cytochrome P450 n=1 Tax=Nonomuraea basaltis TaxID=2495887 RepID=UPI0019809930|nr:cytochrome P450 [Nonomuraea basaltis]
MTLLDELATTAGRENPYPRYDRLRRISAVVRAADGTLVVTRHADCVAVTRDPRMRHQSPDNRLGAFPAIADWSAHPALRLLFTSMLLRNPPDHTRLRRLVSGAFTPRRVQALRAEIARTVDDLLDGMSGELDFMDAFALQLPVIVLGEILGVPAEDRSRFPPLVRQWTQVVEVITPDVLSQADSAAAAIREYFISLVAERRRRPADDLLSELIAIQQADDRFSEDELLTTAGFLLGAGLETTTNLLGNGLFALLQHPEQMDLLRERPDLAPSAVDELLRFDSPTQIVPRSVAEPIELSGITITAGERVVAYLGAGNRDPHRFAEPDRLELDRTGNAPLSFGGGIHHCVGAPLGRLEAEIALPALLGRFPKIALNGVPERRDSLTFRGFTRLPVDVG